MSMVQLGASQVLLGYVNIRDSWNLLMDLVAGGYFDDRGSEGKNVIDGTYSVNLTCTS